MTTPVAAANVGHGGGSGQRGSCEVAAQTDAKSALRATAPNLDLGGLRVQFSGPDEVTEVVDETPTILAIDALETSFSRSIRISSSLPSSLDGPSEPLGRPSKRPRARAATSPSLVRSEIRSGFP